MQSSSISPTDAPANRGGFLRDMAIYSLSSIAVIVIGVVQALVIPAYMGVEEFGYWRLFILYVGYAGFINLGFVDGVLVRWAGLRPTEARNEVRTALLYLTIEQIVVLVPLAVAMTVVGNDLDLWFIVWILFGLFVSGFFALGRTALQATLEFKRLSSINFWNAALFLVGILVIGLLQQWTVTALMVLFIGTNIISTITMFDSDMIFNESPWPAIREVISFGVHSSRLGFFVLLGNIGLILAYTIDRLTVSWTLPIAQFAAYGFAVTFVALIYRVVGTLADVVFPYLMRMTSSQHSQAYQRGKKIVIVISGLSFVTYFVVDFVVVRFLPQYQSSLTTTKILLMGTSIGAMLRMIQVNFFKMRQEQVLFFRSALIVNVFFFASAFFVSQWGMLELFAIVAFIMNFIWYIINDIHLCQTMKISGQDQVREIGAMVLFWVSLLITSSLPLATWNAGLLYFGFACMLSVLLLWSERQWILAVLGSMRPV